MKRVRKFVREEILSSADAWIAILLAIIVAILGLLGRIGQELVSAVVLATLSLVSYSLLALRRELADFSKSLGAFQPSAEHYLLDRRAFKSFAELVRSADQIYLLGPSLIGIFHANSDSIFERVRKGADLRVVLFNPKGQGVESLAQALWVKPEQLAREIGTVIGLCEEYVIGDLGRGNFQLILTDMAPGFSMVITDPDKPSGKVIVEYIGYQSNILRRPHIELAADRDQRWFQYYVEQFQRICGAGTPYEFPSGTPREAKNTANQAPPADG